jgi:hypothetical protein
MSEIRAASIARIVLVNLDGLSPSSSPESVQAIIELLEELKGLDIPPKAARETASIIHDSGILDRLNTLGYPNKGATAIIILEEMESRPDNPKPKEQEEPTE